jgi:hypothetical protein
MVPEPLGGVVAVVLAALLVVLGVLLVELVVELELPQAARPNASTTQPASALILFLITSASPLAGLSLDDAQSTRLSA